MSMSFSFVDISIIWGLRCKLATARRITYEISYLVNWTYVLLQFC